MWDIYRKKGLGQGVTRKHESCQVEKTNVNKLNVLFTNADSLMNKRTDLEIFIGEQLHKPDIIGIVEVKSKNSNDLPQLSEFSLKGYDIHYVNVDKVYGRGVILYTASWLNASPYTTSDSCLESLWVTVRLSGGDRLIIGCIYRSPSSSAENNEKINNQIRSVYSLQVEMLHTY